jgi:hypothetical protein
MAEKGWTGQVAAAAGVAAGTGAAQLGLGYGLGVVVWPAIPAGDDSVWLGSLGWATWIAASSTVFGAVIAGRLGRPPAGGPWRFALAASAAVGALLTVALIALPARAAVRTDTFSPQTIAGGYAVIGVLLGLVIAYWAVVSRPVAANLIATAAWLWSLAVAAIVVSIFWHRESATYLSSWQFASPDPLDGLYGTIYWPSSVLTLLAALVVGVVGAWPAVRRGDLGVGAAASGAVGPLLVAAAFFVLAPQLTGALGPLESAYLIAPYAVLAGLAGSALTVGLGQRAALRRSDRAAAKPPVVAVPTPRKPSSAPAPESPAPRPAKPKAAPPEAAPPNAAPPEAAPPKADRPRADASLEPAEAEPTSETRAVGRARPSLFGRRKRDNAEASTDESAGDRPAAATGRAKAPESRPPNPTGAEYRAASANVVGESRAKAAPAANQSSGARQTVTAPPTEPTIAKINPPREGDPPTPAKTRPSGAKAAPAAKPDPSNIANSDKTPPAKKAAAPARKATPAKKAAPVKKPDDEPA